MINLFMDTAAPTGEDDREETTNEDGGCRIAARFLDDVTTGTKLVDRSLT
jgi:hypothetical protein